MLPHSLGAKQPVPTCTGTASTKGPSHKVSTSPGRLSCDTAPPQPLTRPDGARPKPRCDAKQGGAHGRPALPVAASKQATSEALVPVQPHTQFQKNLATAVRKKVCLGPLCCGCYCPQLPSKLARAGQPASFPHQTHHTLATT